MKARIRIYLHFLVNALICHWETIQVKYFVSSPTFFIPIFFSSNNLTLQWCFQVYIYFHLSLLSYFFLLGRRKKKRNWRINLYFMTYIVYFMSPLTILMQNMFYENLKCRIWGTPNGGQHIIINQTPKYLLEFAWGKKNATIKVFLPMPKGWKKTIFKWQSSFLNSFLLLKLESI